MIREDLQKYFSQIDSNAKNISITDIDGLEIEESLAYKKIYSKLERIQKERAVIHFIGNGASASIASHFSLDYFKAGQIRTNTFNDLSALTAYGNDISFDEVFAYPISRTIDKDDMLIVNLNCDNSAYGLKYERLVPVLVNAIKELSAEVEQLKSKLNN